ncbi:hypothetical protein [Streptomyces sp. SCL15-4]|uniref:hypothetical protein n=1 Tax=Streptomyces sp. SCL15-4 TaxID=2967221 RepID=UPI0029666115|nr:hypothetical protein [Streptomyces sp. SCL15-4]
MGLGLLGTARGGGEQMRHGRHEPAGRVGVLDELAQDRGELLLVDVVGAKVVLDLLEASEAIPTEARTRSSRVRGRPVTGWWPWPWR